MLNRRSLITGLISFVAAPAIVRVESLMKLPMPEKIMTLDDYNIMINEVYYQNRLFWIMPNSQVVCISGNGTEWL